MKLQYLGLGLAGLLFVAPGCGKEEPPPPPPAPTQPPPPPQPAQLTGYNLSLSVNPEPAMVGMNQIILDVTDGQNAVVTGASLSAEITGGPAPLMATFAPDPVAGRYATNVEFAGPGNYTLKVKVMIPEKGEFSQDVALNNVQAPEGAAPPAAPAAGKPAAPAAPKEEVKPDEGPHGNRGDGSGNAVGQKKEEEAAKPGTGRQKGENRGKGSGDGVK